MSQLILEVSGVPGTSIFEMARKMKVLAKKLTINVYHLFNGQYDLYITPSTHMKGLMEQIEKDYGLKE